MPDTWMTVAEAATALKVHPRTIERRIAGGKFQARRAEDGILHVLVSMPDTPDSPEQALEAVRELAADQVTLATGSASALIKFAQSDALRAREEISVVRQDAGRARRSAVAAWCVVAALGTGVCVAVGWTSSEITRARGQVQTLTRQAEQIERENARLASERDSARQDALQAKVAEAQASGQLAAYVEQADKRPTTRPAGLIQRIASAIAEGE